MNSIYLVLDMQNDLVHAEGPNGKSPLGEQVRDRKVIANTVAALAKARSAGIKVGFVRVGFSASYPECPAGSPVFSGAPKAGLFKLGGWGTEIHAELEQREGHDRDFEMIVIEDGSAAHSADEHKNSMGSIGRFCKIETSSTVSFG